MSCDSYKTWRVVLDVTQVCLIFGCMLVLALTPVAAAAFLLMWMLSP